MSWRSIPVENTIDRVADSAAKCGFSWFDGIRLKYQAL
jgi:hypothetical protein